jgi:hypothetical protein
VDSPEWISLQMGLHDRTGFDKIGLNRSCRYGGDIHEQNRGTPSASVPASAVQVASGK